MNEATNTARQTQDKTELTDETLDDVSGGYGGDERKGSRKIDYEWKVEEGEA